MKHTILFTVAVVFFMYSPLQAQDTVTPETGNDVVVVSYFKCYSSDLGEVNQMVKQDLAPILNRSVEEGKLVDWGTMTHYWVDEWNYILYYVAEDLGTFETAFSEIYSQGMEVNPKFLEELDALCPEHKDNIYHHGTGYQASTGDMN